MRADHDVDENTCNLGSFPPQIVETTPVGWNILVKAAFEENIIKTTTSLANDPFEPIAMIHCPPGEIFSIHVDPNAMKCTLENILVRLCMNSAKGRSLDRSVHDRNFRENRAIAHLNTRIRTVRNPSLRAQYSSLLTSSAMCTRLIMVRIGAGVTSDSGFSGGPKVLMDSAQNTGYSRVAFEYPWSDTVALDPKEEHDGTSQIFFIPLVELTYEELTNEVIFRHTEVPYRRKVGGDGAFWFFCDDPRD